MKSTVLLGLVGAATINAHPTHTKGKSIASRKVVDLEEFRLTSTTNYENSDATVANLAIRGLPKRASYVDTATELVKKVVPGAEFRLKDDHYVDTNNGVAHVYFKQVLHGLDIDSADFSVNIARDGSVFSYGHSFYTGEVPSENPLTKRAFVEPTEALSGAVEILQLPVTGQATAEPLEKPETFALKGTSGAQSDPEARLVYFVKPDGSLALTWRVETDILDDWLLSYVDANSNSEVHGVVNYVAEASYEVYPRGTNDPTEGDREVLIDPWDLETSEFTWLGDGTGDISSTTRGNNGISQTNPSGGSGYLNNYRPISDDLTFEYPYDTSMVNQTAYWDASITQLFYSANMYHDLLYDLGFTEAAGNFELNNNNQGGKGNDFVILNAQDGSGTNNANFATPPDGGNGRMRMYMWTATTPRRDCSFEAGVVIHEYTHGLSNRLTGGPDNSGCLSALESGGMGEGWGDFYSLAVRLRSTDTRETDYGMGSWVSGKPNGIRAFLYSTNLTTNPQTYATVNTLSQVHAIGTVWANMLYELLWTLIDKHGKNDGMKPEFDADGVPTDGKFLTMKLVLDGMALQPCNPNFIQARGAILDADTALTGSSNFCSIWTAFGKHGLGESAAWNGGGSSRKESFVVPDGVC